MKKIFLTIAVLLSFLQLACENGFSPHGKFVQQYVLNCVLRQDTTMQVATLTKTYDISGYNPDSNTQDPSVTGALIKIFYHDSTFIMRDTVVARSDTSRYTSPIHFYYVKNLSIASNLPVSIEADLPDGTVLKSSAHTVSLGSYFYFNGDEVIPILNRDYVLARWQTNSNEDNPVYFLPKLSVVYYKKDTGPGVIYSKEIPYGYIQSGGVTKAAYPHISSGNYLTYNMSAVTKAIEEIAPQGADKSDYCIRKIVLEVFVFDQSMASYVSSLQTFLDGFTVQTEAPDITNISGGYGVFGCYIRKVEKFYLSASYISSLGYTPSF